MVRKGSFRKRFPKSSFPWRTSFRELCHAEQHDIRQEILRQAERRTHNSWLFLLSVQLVLFVSIASVTHADLLLNTPVKLPVVQIGVQAGLFFLLAPLMLVLVHGFTLLRHYELAVKVVEICRANDTKKSPIQPLPDFHLPQIMMLESTERGRRWAYHLLHWSTLALAPLGLLLLAQATYLPLHDTKMVWWHRIVIIIDALLVVLYARAFRRLKCPGTRWPFRFTLYVPAVGAPLFALLVVTVPDGAVERFICGHVPRVLCPPVPWGIPESADPLDEQRHAFWPTAWLFEGDINRATGRLNSPFARNLFITRLPHRVEGQVLNLRKRDLRYAILDGLDFSNVDFTASDLTGASLQNTNLKNATFGCAKIGKPILPLRNEQGVGPFWKPLYCENWHWAHPPNKERCTILTRANLSGADLTGAKIGDARLDFANLSGTKMPGMKFTKSCLFMANLSKANVKNGKFYYSTLSGGNYVGTNFEGAIFVETEFFMSILSGANMRNIKVESSPSSFFKNDGKTYIIENMEREDEKGKRRPANFTFSLSKLVEADLQCANLSGADFYVANLYRANLGGAIPPSKTSRLHYSLLADLSTDEESCPHESSDFLSKVNSWWIESSNILPKPSKDAYGFAAEISCLNPSNLTILFRKALSYMNLLDHWYDYSGYYSYIVHVAIDKRIELLSQPPRIEGENIASSRRIDVSMMEYPDISETFKAVLNKIKNGACTAFDDLDQKLVSRIKSSINKEKEKKAK